MVSSSSSDLLGTFYLFAGMFGSVFDYGRIQMNLTYGKFEDEQPQSFPKNNSRGYVVKYNVQKTFYPIYAKTSKMINGNRRGNHINLEKRLDSKLGLNKRANLK